jgi:hypothetical protein
VLVLLEDLAEGLQAEPVATKNESSQLLLSVKLALGAEGKALQSGLEG